MKALARPSDEATFLASKLDFSERKLHRAAYALHCDLLALRRDDPVLARAGTYRPEGAVLGPRTFLLRYIDAEHGDRLLVVNLDAISISRRCGSRCSRRRAGRCGGWRGAARRRSTAVRARRRGIRTNAG
jgi:hypothetical protein